LPALHATHASPALPQTALLVPLWQTPFASQQPVAQLPALQPHTPSRHCWPAAHARQAEPFAPQAADEICVTQVEPAQQPFEQSPAPQYPTHA
jgi:hypothetical protein